ACLLGCLHGPVDWTRKRREQGIGGTDERGRSPNPDSLYLSVHCNHTYSASPAYVREYCAEHGLTPPMRNVLESVLRKSAFVQVDPLPTRTGKALCRRAETLRLRERVQLVITSPPYFRAQSYAWDNWLRLWCLGYDDYRVVERELLYTESVQRYYE